MYIIPFLVYNYTWPIMNMISNPGQKKPKENTAKHVGRTSHHPSLDEQSHFSGIESSEMSCMQARSGWDFMIDTNIFYDDFRYACMYVTMYIECFFKMNSYMSFARSTIALWGHCCFFKCISSDRT